LKNLKDRHSSGLIYTYIGEVCISINPYKTLDIYGKPAVNHYKVKIASALSYKVTNFILNFEGPRDF